jgi:hypothetical protein
MTDPKPTETVVPAITAPAQVKTKAKRAPTEYNNFCAETLKTLSSFPPKERLTECGRLWKLQQAGKPKTDTTTTTTSSTTETVAEARASTASSVQSDKKDVVTSSEPKTKKAPAEKKSPTEKSAPVKKQAMPKKEQSVSAH